MRHPATEPGAGRRATAALLAAGLIVLAHAPALLATVPAPERPSRRWAVLVGRADPAAGAAAAVEPELRGLAATLRDAYGYAPANVIEVYGEQATADAVRRVLTGLVERVEPPDTVVAYLALPVARTQTDAAFLTAGGRPDEPWTVLPAFELEKTLAQLRARATMLMLPSCEGRDPAHVDAEAIARAAYARPSDQWLVVLAYCAPRQPAVGAAAFARQVRESLQPGRLGPAASPAALVEALASGEGPFRARLWAFPERAAQEFAFVPQTSRLSAPLAALASATAPAAREEAISALVAVIAAEAPERRAELLSDAGPALLRIARDPQDAARLRAVAALGEIGYQEAAGPLRDMATGDPDPRARQTALDAVQRLGGDPALLALRAALRDTSADVRTTAVRGLGSRRDTPSFDAMLQLTRDREEPVRVAALQTIALFRDRAPAVRAAAVAMLADPSPTVRREGASVLGGLGPAPADPALLALLRDPEAGVRQAAAYSLGRSFVEADRAVAERALSAALEDRSPLVREAAVFALAAVKGPLAERRLREALRDPSAAVRHTATERLGTLRSAAAVPSLIDMLKDPDVSVRQAAATALGRIGDPRATDPLLVALKDENPFVRGAAEDALERVRSAPSASLTAKLKDPSPRVRAEAARKIGESGGASGVADLLAALADDDYAVRQAATESLQKLRDDASFGRVVAALSHRDFRVRQGAAAALGVASRPAAQQQRALVALAPLLRDPSAAVRAQVVRAMSALGRRDDPDVLAAARDTDATVRLALAQSLAGASSTHATATLRLLARDASADVRQAAIAGLGRRSAP
ncbi:MAG TPA: HEAT repeat domain-containing protein [Vicinamibacteria bacterium]